MIDVLKVFYQTHYNFAALSILLLLLFIFLLTKKNFRVGIIIFAALIALNVFIFKKTDGKAWTIYIEQPAVTDSYGYTSNPEPITMTFSAKKNWTIKDEQGNVHHWCWVDAAWDSFASMDLVAKIWGENSAKKMTKSTESRVNDAE
ncbi:MAG: hypothetical protein MJZ05_03800 [Fibrobacter sp.]|nr:hypothetical protein [Fibrobacter sp.]